MQLQIRAVTDQDCDWVRSLLRDRWGASEIVTRGRDHHADRLPGLIATEAEQLLGLITYALENGQCEIVSLDSLQQGRGIGSALVNAVVDLARAQRCRRVWCVTTNDNRRAMDFYKKLGFTLVAVHRDAVVQSRQRKPSIPERGCDNIPIRDEIELEISIQ